MNLKEQENKELISNLLSALRTSLLINRELLLKYSHRVRANNQIFVVETDNYAKQIEQLKSSTDKITLDIKKLFSEG